MNRYEILFAAFMLPALSLTAAENQLVGDVSGLRIYAVCFAKDDQCSMQVQDIRGADVAPATLYVHPQPLFAFRHSVGWAPCEASRICLRFDKRDVSQWNTLFADKGKFETAMILDGRVLCVVGVRGAMLEKLVIDQADGESPPNALRTYLEQRSSVGVLPKAD